MWLLGQFLWTCSCCMLWVFREKRVQESRGSIAVWGMAAEREGD